MLINKKLLITLGLFSVFILGIAATMPQEPANKATNLKVLPKNLTDKQLDAVMDEWAHSLGVRCNFCHVRGEDGKMDFANDSKPEKKTARDMFKMMNDINKKYFKAKKDSLGMVVTAGVNCYTCHKATPHPEVVSAPAPQRRPRPQGGAPGAAPGTTPPATPPGN